MTVTRAAAAFGVALALVFSMPGTVRAQDKYKVRLSTVPMDGGMRSTVAGRGSATAVLTGTKLTIDGTFEGLLSPASGGAVHRGVAKGVRGAAIGGLTVTKAQQGTVSGSVDLTAAQVQALKNGHLYVQIASEKAPDGNLWGWLVQ